jgi:hypothetical protein
MADLTADARPILPHVSSSGVGQDAGGELLITGKIQETLRGGAGRERWPPVRAAPETGTQTILTCQRTNRELTGKIQSVQPVA